MDLAERPSLNGKVSMFYPDGEGAGMPGVGQSTEQEEQTPGGEVQGRDPGSVSQETPTSSTTSTAATAQGVEVDADTVVDLSNTGMSEADVDCHVEPLLEGVASGASTPFDAWMDIDGKEVHKTTVTRIFLGPDAAPSSNDRARRVRGYGRGNSGRAAANLLKEADGGDDMWADALIGQPFATLVELVTGSHALCIFTLTKGVDRTAGSAQLLSGIRVRLREAVGNGASTDDVGAPSVEGTERGEGQSGAETSWRWDGGRTHGGKECKIPAALALPLNPAFGESSENVVFTLDSLRAVLHALAMLVDTTPDASSKVLKASQTSAAGLPYHESLKGGSRTPDIPSRLDCLLCGRCSIPVLEMRPHVSAHVLQAQMDVDAGRDAAQILNPETCCFCGRIGTCLSALRTGSRKTTSVCTSTCPHAPRVGAKEVMDVGIQVGQMKKVSTNQPCTNLPMKCELCPPGTVYVWKYLMPVHIAQKHGGANGVLQGGSPDFRASNTILEDERKQVLDMLAVVPRPGARNSSTARTPSRKRSGDNHQGARGAARPRTSEGGASGDVGGSTAPETGQPRRDDDVVRI